MKRIIIFSGTTEGRRLSELLCDNGIEHIVSVATEYGRKLCPENACAKVVQGRMDRSAMCAYLEKEKMDVVIDATHPYAVEVTENIKCAVELLCARGQAIQYLRYVRKTDMENTVNANREEDGFLERGSRIRYFQSAHECEQALHAVAGNILLTTGSKELSVFCRDKTVKDRLVVRVLPGPESLALCEEQGMSGKQIIAMQGPFSEELNLALIRQYRIQCLVTKQSGNHGGFMEKVIAAETAGISLFVIGTPVQESGNSLQEILRVIGVKDDAVGKEPESVLQIGLIGCGMGAEDMLTAAAIRSIEQADIILGAERLIEPYSARMEKKPYYLAKDILPYLKVVSERNTGYKLRVVVLFSGDTGFYSGYEKLYAALNTAVMQGELSAEIYTVPGISSVSYLSSRLHLSWSQAAIVSIHGRSDEADWKDELLKTVRDNAKTYLLVSGVKDIICVMTMLRERNVGNVLYAGYRLSYSDEKIYSFKLGDDVDAVHHLPEGLYTCLILRDEKEPEREGVQIMSTSIMKKTLAIPDSEFIRGKVPMTKEEIREVSIAKLRLTDQAVVYDIGSGTGSVAVTIAGLSDQIEVYAIERKPEALELIEQNCKKFQRENIHIIEAQAPEGLTELPAPTHAFIGGSGGHIKEIVASLYRKNPSMRVVINAVSMDTMQECLLIGENHSDSYKIEDFSMVQVGVTRIREIGGYHMMQGENPVWVCAFSFV